MFPLKMLLVAASVAAFSATGALAQSAPDAGQQPHAWHKPSPEEMTQWHAQMCKSHYAREAGKLAYLQADLSITDAQRGAFDRWRDVVLASAKAHSDACLTHTPDGHHMHDALERNARMQKMLEAKLAELKNERPALETLYASLTPEQKTLFDRMGGHHHGHHMGHMGERFGEGHEHGQPQGPG